ncbi:MAG: GldG family protein [Anaerolineae bacterium]|nr:GldG family protein [Anaerolineae bacterium]
MEESKFRQVLKKIQEFLKQVGFITGPLSLAAILGGLFRSLVLRAPWDDPITLGFLIGGVVLGALFILGNPTQVRTTLTKRGTLYGLNAALMSIAFIAIMVIVNIVAVRYKVDYDATELQVHTLSAQSKQVVKELDQKIEIIGFFSGSDYWQQDSFEELLDQYMRETDMLSYKVIDPDSQPLEARAYEEPYSGLLIRSETRTERVFSAREQDITGAILKVTSDTPKTVYFLTGHQEHDPDAGGNDGYSTVSDWLRSQNYEVKTLNLALITDTIPSDATVIVIAGPQKKLLEGELTQLQAYLASGGRALIMQDPFSEADLNVFLFNWQIRFEDGLAIDQMRYVENPTYPATDSYQYSAITQDMNGLIAVFPLARGVSQIGDAASADITYTPLVETSAQSWGETSQEVVERDEADILGPLALAAAVESQPILAAGSDDAGAKTRIVLIGDSDFASNATADIPGNGVLFLNAVNWLAEEEQLIAIGPKDTQGQPVSFDEVASNLICFGSIFGVPGIILGAGIVVWIVQRLQPKIVTKPTSEENEEVEPL